MAPLAVVKTSSAGSTSSADVERCSSSEDAASTCSPAPSVGPEDTDASGAAAAAAGRPRKERTTLMMRNLPNDYTRDKLVQVLDAEGFARCYDFVYLPMDHDTAKGVGYAFVNLVDPALVACFTCCFEGYSKWSNRSEKVCQVTWSDREQGLKANIKRYRFSPVMHPSVADECKPCLFSNGVRVPFPAHGRAFRNLTRRA